MSTNILPFGKYYIDSGKFFIDKTAFKEVNIPENFTLTDADTGELIDEFKKSSLSIPYKKHKIYISNVSKKLSNSGRDYFIDKVLIYFPAKISDNYFNGISREDVIGVLEYLKDKSYLTFDNVDHIYNSIFVKDLDIKMDNCLNKSDKIDIKEYNQDLKSRFIGTPDAFKLIDSKKQGFGIQCYERSKSSLTRPFFKFYDKSMEIKKDIDFFDSLPNEVREILISKFVYRYEFTMKDNTFFKKYEISNNLAEIHKVSQEKWKEIGRQFLSNAFDKKVYSKDLGRIKYRDRVVASMFLVMYQKNNMTKGQIESIWVTSAKNRKEKCLGKKEFHRLWAIATTPSEHTQEMMDTLKRVGKWDKYFGLI
jgi:hypothetical protein